MPRKILYTVLVMLVIAGPVMAQGDDPLYPEGAIPWPIPNWPIMQSPTPYPLRDTPTPQPYSLTETPTPTPTATATPTTTPTPAPADAEQGQLGTLAAQNSEMNATLQALSNEPVNGYSMDTAAEQIGNYARFFFGYAKGLQLNNIRGMGIVVSFLLLALAFMLLVRLVTGLMPMMTTFARWTMDLLKLVAEFLPF